MNQNFQKLMKQRHKYAKRYGVLLIFAIMIPLTTIVFIIESIGLWISRKSIANCGFYFDLVLAIIAIGLDVITYYYWKKLKKIGIGASRVQPYIMKLPFYDKEDIYLQIQKHVKIKSLTTDVMHGVTKGQRNVRLFLLEMPEYHKKEYKNLTSKAVRHAQKKHGMKTKLTMSESYKAIRINLLLLDNFTEEAYERVEVNASYDLCYAEGNLNVIVDLKTMTLYLPAFLGDWYGASAKYCYAVKKLLKILQLE